MALRISGYFKNVTQKLNFSKWCYMCQKKNTVFNYEITEQYFFIKNTRGILERWHGIVFKPPYKNGGTTTAKQKRNNLYNTSRQGMYTNSKIRADRDKLATTTKSTCSKNMLESVEGMLTQFLESQGNRIASRSHWKAHNSNRS